MMMSGKQFSLDSRIDLAEAVEDAHHDPEQDTMELPVAPPGPPLKVPVTIGICKLCKKVYRPEVGAASSYLADLWTIFREI